MDIQLSDHFTYKKLIQFTLPTIGMTLFTSIYTIVDGFFVSNFVGKIAFASVNLIIPFLMILGGMGAMIGVGGSALVAKTLGEQKDQRACEYFTMMIELMVIIGIAFTIIGYISMPFMAKLFGATDVMMHDTIIYGRTCVLFNTMLLAQYTFQGYLVVAEKPKLGLYITVAAGVGNMVLDFLFMAIFQWGVIGAALATGISQTIGGLLPILWLVSKKNTSRLHFIKTRIELKPTLKACANGISEMLSSISGSITGILYNLMLIKYAGEDGVAAYGVVMYAAFIFIGIFMGYSSGSSPIMSYHYGAQNHKEMKSIRSKSIRILFSSSIVLTTIAILSAGFISSVFVGYDMHLYEITKRAFIICSIPFLVMWFNMYISSLFTALNDGAVSAAIAFVRSLLFPVICILLFPYLWKLDGVWYSLVGSEILSFFVSLLFFISKKKKYKY